MLFLAANGRHAQSFNENRADYERVIDEFLQKYVDRGLQIKTDCP
jgi:uncharacterized protein